MDSKNKDTPKKCFCARCFHPIDEEDKVDVGGQNFHRMCSTCCICRTVPKQLKMFYGHVFCAECFKTHVLSRFRENSRVHTDSWWMQFAPGVKTDQSGCKAEEASEKPTSEKPASEKPASEESASEKPASASATSEGCKRCTCARCLLPVDDHEKIEIGGQAFHCCCAKCCACHKVPKDSVKIYYGQVFCDDCFHRLVLNRNKDNSQEFFKCCFDQWQNNPQFAEYMKSFMASTSSEAPAPVVFMMHGPNESCRRDERADGQTEWFQNNEPKKSAADSVSLGAWDYLSFENRTETSDALESFTNAAEKIEKLTKYLVERDPMETPKKWKNSLPSELEPLSNWVNLNSNSKLSNVNCPKCLWQCGTIYVDRFVPQKDCVVSLC